MPQTLIVTDLTRFQNPDLVCLAGIDPETGVCIRPLPYLQRSVCKKLKIFPGGKLVSTFAPSGKIVAPHTEDHTYGKLYFQGAASGTSFKNVLNSSCFESVNAGFVAQLKKGEKVIPSTHCGPRSLITIKVDPTNLEIIPDQFNDGKIKVHFRDGSGQDFRYLPITDLGFYEYAFAHHKRSELDDLNEWIQEQDELYLRIGLGRRYKNPKGIEGYWVQVNGIYTFPEKHPLVRNYS